MGLSGRRPTLFSPGNRPSTHCTGIAWAPGAVWTGAKNLGVPVFDPRILQPVASRYTDRAIPATNIQYSRKL